MPAPKFKSKIPVPYESEIQKSILQYLAYHPKVAWCARFNAGRASMPVGNGKFRPIQFNTLVGCPDIMGQLKNGTLLCVEIKRPPWTKPTDAHERQQDEFLAKVRANRGVGFFATSVKQVEDALKIYCG